MSVFFHKNDLPADVSFGKSVAVDTETQGLSLVRDKLCLVQLSDGQGDAHIVQVNRDTYDCPNLKSLMADTNVEKIFHFARFDLAVLKRRPWALMFGLYFVPSSPQVLCAPIRIVTA